MDLQARKLEFIKEFLKLQSEEVITRFEQLLKNESLKDASIFSPMSIEELNQRIDISEEDFKNGRFKTTEELVTKFK